MLSRKLVFTLYVLLLMCLATSWANAAFDETYKLYVGGSVTDFETSLRINSRDDSIDNEIKLEEGLGFNSTVQVGFIRGFWRMANRHRLSLLYTPLRRTSELTLQNDIDVGGNLIKAGAYVGTSVRTHVFDIEYLYSFYKRPKIELGITAGLYWMNSVAEVVAAGEVIIEGETQPEFRGDYQANQRLIAPLPLIGLTGTYEINDKWRLKAQARFFDVTISDIDGYLFSSGLGAEYYFTKHVGLGASLSWFELSVKHNGVVFINTLAYEYAGLQAYLALKY
jgi:hypothetical protein